MRTFILWLLLACACFAQERSIVCIKVPNGYQRDDSGNVIGSASTAGTGCIVAVDEGQPCPDQHFSNWVLAKILTAAHVVDGNPPHNGFLRGGEQTTLRILKKGNIENDDVALCDAYIPPGYEPLPVCADDTELLDYVTVHGLAGLVGKWPVDARKIDGVRIGRQWKDGRAYYDAAVSPGDSGGPILVDGKLVGVVSGGIMVRQNQDEEFFRTWPLVSVTPSRIREIIRESNKPPLTKPAKTGKLAGN